ncbi:unnamed protein product [Caenorhabditis sp. 36 PRJEB53466]|nr:unnamed protein product [Caenorhabditis sp. 36 PRJEB53466]
MTTRKRKEVELVDNVSFERLRSLILEVKEKETDSRTLFESIDDEDGLVVRYELAKSMALKLEEKRIKCKNYKTKIEMVQKLILAKRRIMYEVQDKIDKKNKDQDKLVDKTKALGTQVESNKSVKQKYVKNAMIMNRLCAYRKTFLLQEVMEVFKIDIDGGPASMQPNRPKRDCKCVLVDTIRGLHLPHVASIQLSPHNESETTAAIGLLIQMIDAISRILEYPLRYSVIPYSSSSRIVCPLEDKIAVLSGWKKRSERERFFEGLGWLGKNIAQLRSDCGIPTPVADKTLSILSDWIRSVTEGKYVSIYDRPINNVRSPSSLLINFQQLSAGDVKQ